MTSGSTTGMGRLVAVHVVSPAHIQRAVFIAILSFLFFLAMMLTFYLRQNILYFLLATAFMVVYLLTMFSLVVQRRSVLQIFENGIAYKKRTLSWSQIKDVSVDGTITVNTGKPLILSTALNDLAGAIDIIRKNANADR